MSIHLPFIEFGLQKLKILIYVYIHLLYSGSYYVTSGIAEV